MLKIFWTNGKLLIFKDYHYFLNFCDLKFLGKSLLSAAWFRVNVVAYEQKAMNSIPGPAVVFSLVENYFADGMLVFRLFSI